MSTEPNTLGTEPRIDTVPSLVRGLEATLSTQIEGYRRFLETIGRKRDAIKNAQLDRVPEIAAIEEQIVHRLERLDRRRTTEARRLAEAVGVDPDATISEVVAAIEETDGSKLAVLATQLRELVERAKREHSVVRAAADSLARHMAGIVQSVTGALSGT
ncbi:MAG: flagellar protein FlgN, partial [Planctomycetota bacterium]